MKKWLLILCLLSVSALNCFAENLNSDIYLFCNNTGADKYKYDMLMIQELIVNDLQMTTEQRKDLENIFNLYIDDYAVLASDLAENQELYKKMKKDKTSFKVKSKQRKKINDIKKEVNKLQIKIEKEIKYILTSKQKTKYKTIVKSVFK